MAHYGTLRGAGISDITEDIRGSHLYGLNEEKLGKIDDVIFDHATGNINYVVVDTGWLTTKKFLVPAQGLRASAKHENDFEASLGKRQIESFPPYDEADLEDEKKWSGYEEKFRAKWVTGPVMHRAETDRNITPTTYQQNGNLNSEAAAAETHGSPIPVRSSRVPSVAADADLAAATSSERTIPAGTDSMVIGNSAAGISGNWDTFQSRLRERRKQAVTGCSTCTGESAVKRGSDSVDTLRKAV